MPTSSKGYAMTGSAPPGPEPQSSFSSLMSRADDVVLQELMGADIVRLLRSIDPELSTPSKLRELLLGFKTPAELLRDPSTRRLLLELLPESSARQLCEHLGVESGYDPFEELAKLSPRGGSVRESRLFAFFGQHTSFEETLTQSADWQTARGEYQLFEHQREAVSNLNRILSSGKRRVLLHMPTGSGKTRTAMNVIAGHLRASEPSLVLWLAFSEELCEQAIDEFVHAWRFLGNRRIDVLRFWGSHNPDLHSVKDGMIVAGLGKVYNYALDSISSIASLADKVTLVTIDEAHQSIAPSYRLVLDTVVEKQPRTALMGLSATPGRTWNEIDQDQELADFFLRQKVSLEVQGYANPVEYLIEEGYLARPTFTPLFYDSGNDLSARDMAEIEDSLDIPGRLLERLAKDDQRNLRIVQRTEQVTRSHERTILFANSVSHSRLLAAVLRARGIESYAVSGETPAPERHRVINKFRSAHQGSIVLCNYGVLTAGFDAPNTSAAILARPTKSLVLYSQMIGRALRGRLAGGNEEAEIITVFDTRLPGFGDLAESFYNWEDVWT